MEPSSSESLRTISILLAPALELLTLGTSTPSPQTESRLLVITISYHWLLSVAIGYYSRATPSGVI